MDRTGPIRTQDIREAQGDQFHRVADARTVHRRLEPPIRSLRKIERKIATSGFTKVFSTQVVSGDTNTRMKIQHAVFEVRQTVTCHHSYLLRH